MSVRQSVTIPATLVGAVRRTANEQHLTMSPVLVALAERWVRAEFSFRAFALMVHRSELTITGHHSDRDWNIVKTCKCNAFAKQMQRSEFDCRARFTMDFVELAGPELRARFGVGRDPSGVAQNCATSQKQLGRVQNQACEWARLAK